MFRLRLALVAIEIARDELRALCGQFVSDDLLDDCAELDDYIQELGRVSLIVRRALGRREQAALQRAQVKG